MIFVDQEVTRTISVRPPFLLPSVFNVSLPSNYLFPVTDQEGNCLNLSIAHTFPLLQIKPKLLR